MTAQREKPSFDRLSEVFREQFALITREQAIALGFSASAISRLVACGKWMRIQPRVYRLSAAPERWEQWVLAACLSGGPGTVASHECAAALHGLDGVGRGPVEVWTLRRMRGEGIRCHLAQLQEGDRTRISGIPVTSVERTLLDLASRLEPARLEIVMDSALRQRKTTIARLRWRLQQAPRHGVKGIGVLRRLVETRTNAPTATESVLEVQLVQAIRRAGLPAPHLQYRVMDGPRVVGRFDCAYPGAKLIIELDGYRWHSGNRAWQRDRRRDNDLNRLGWTVLRFTAEDLKDSPEVIRQISAVLRPSLDV